MLASLLARYSEQGHREMDRYAAWLAAWQRLREDWVIGVRPEVAQLPDSLDGVPGPQRAEALQDLIAEHLRLSWSVGSGPRLEAYLAAFGKEFSELASPVVVPAELVEDEFLARHQWPHGDTPLVREYQQRFPARPDVIELLARRCLDGGRFVKLRRRGLGAMGEIWEAHDHGYSHRTGDGVTRCKGCRVAIKKPRGGPAEPADALRCFAEEARVTAVLDHPGIVALREHRPDAGGPPIYLMRLVEGQTFAERIREFHRPPVNRTQHEQRRQWHRLLQSFVRICNTMGHAHDRGVLHRDLKPGNVMITEPGDPVILDWGMATRASFALLTGSSRNLIVGTPDYMPPEQADGRADTRSDVFSLGAILYEVLTGQSPHGWSDEMRPVDWMSLVRAAQFQLPRRLRPQIPRPLEAISMKALAREPENRYQAVADLGEDVRRHLAGERVSAWAEPIWTRTWRWWRNKR